MSGSTHRASLARGGVGLDDYPGVRPDGINVSPEIADDPAHLVADRHRRIRGVLASRDVQVGAADTDTEDVDHDLAMTGDRFWSLSELKLARARSELRQALHTGRRGRAPRHRAAIMDRT
jgi:hypothetical protein